LFILGISALVTPLVVNSQLIRQEVPVMIGVSGLLILLALDGNVGHLDAGLLFTLAIAYTVFLVVQSRRDTQAAEARLAQETPQGSNWDRHWTVQVLLIVGGLALLVLGARWLVGSAVAFAKALGVSDVIIGLTIVAAGTSLPEVATSVMAAIRGERDIAVGNVVGSNIFNILACLGLSGLAAADGLVVAPAVLNFDLWLGTALYMFMADIVGNAEMSTNERVETFSLVDGTSNVLSLVIQLFFVGRAVKHMGVGRTLAILPVVSLLGFMLLAINPAFLVVAVFTAIRRGIGFGFAKPTHDMLYSVVTPSEKYKAKNLIETAVYRGGDLVGSWVVKFVWAIGISGISILMLPFGVFWVLLALWLGKDYLRRDRPEPAADPAR
jgi:K+-dependent Na+/Ca+ exchanger-like protein